MGAKAVFVDNDTLLWGLMRDGNPKGLSDMLTMLNDELKLSMVLTHSTNIESVTARESSSGFNLRHISGAINSEDI